MAYLVKEREHTAPYSVVKIIKAAARTQDILTWALGWRFHIYYFPQENHKQKRLIGQRKEFCLTFENSLLKAKIQLKMLT